MKDPIEERSHLLNRRAFLSKTSTGIGTIALGSLLGSFSSCTSKVGSSFPNASTGILDKLHFAPKAKRVIYLFQSGGPSQLELFDYKPELAKRRGEDLPESIRKGQRLTGMTSGQDKFPLANSIYNFQQYGQSRAWVSELLPYTSKVVDDICIIKSMHTEAINHDPAVTFFQTGSQQPGRPAMGSWMSYGLGSENENLPGFCVLLSRGSGRKFGQPLYSRLWGNGFLHSLHQGVQFRSGKDPVLFLNDPKEMSKMSRRKMLDMVAKLNQKQYEETQDPEIQSRISQYEMAYKMQTSVPELMDVSGEPDHIYKMYGPDSMQPGTFAANCLLARRMAEKGVRFVQLYHMGWDQHDNLPTQIKGQADDLTPSQIGVPITRISAAIIFF